MYDIAKQNVSEIRITVFINEDFLVSKKFTLNVLSYTYHEHPYPYWILLYLLVCQRNSIEIRKYVINIKYIEIDVSTEI